MKVVGFQSGHDVSYCILENGVPIVHSEWERFLRVKCPQGDGLKFLFDHEEDTGALEDVEAFTHGNPRTRFGLWAYNDKPEKGEYPCFNIESDKMMRGTGATYNEYSHHLCHAANAYFSSNFNDALIITLDGGGWENESDYPSFKEGFKNKDGVPAMTTAAAVYIGQANKIYPQHVHPAEEINIGNLWYAVTSRVCGLSWGYPGGNAAGTLMAMAAMGTDMTERRSEISNSLGFPEHWYREENIKILKEWVGDNEDRKNDMAASVQSITETAVNRMVGFWIKQLKEHSNYEVTKLCIAGGVALNSVAMGKVQEWYPQIKELYIPPVPYDSGLSIGSAQYHYHHVLDQPRVYWRDNFSPYLGKKYSEKDIMLAIQDHDLEFEQVTDTEVIDLLCKDDNVISVYGGHSESGMRALGNRSIIADPRSKTMKAVINEKVKHRQSFRPFAPSILREEVSNWFIRDVESPYMTLVVPFKDEVVDKIPAVCHVNNTARLQTVTEASNPWYYNFIKKFKDKTGVPILLNTSFNDREPIVETPDHAISCFQKTDIDYLYFFDCGLLIKKQ